MSQSSRTAAIPANPNLPSRAQSTRGPRALAESRAERRGGGRVRRSQRQAVATESETVLARYDGSHTVQTASLVRFAGRQLVKGRPRGPGRRGHHGAVRAARRPVDENGGRSVERRQGVRPMRPTQYGKDHPVTGSARLRIELQGMDDRVIRSIEVPLSTRLDALHPCLSGRHGLGELPPVRVPDRDAPSGTAFPILDGRTQISAL